MLPLHVILTIGSLSAEDGGPTRSVTALARELSRQNVEVEIITCASLSGAEFASNLEGSVKIHRLPVSCRVWPWIGRFHSFFETIQSLRLARGRTILHDTGLWLATNHACAVAARALDLPLMLSPRGMLSPWSMTYRRWKKWLAWLIYQKRDLSGATALHATSRAEAVELRALGLRQPIAVVPNGVELPPADVCPADVTQGHARRAGERTVLFLSRLHPKKGLMDLVDTWAALKPQGWRVMIGGGGEPAFRSEIEYAIHSHGLADRFRLLGEVSDSAKWELYGHADLFVLPSRSENFGLAIAEALASGVPVITTRNTPWKELDERQCGWWIEAGSPALRGALQEALALTDSDRRKMGENGRRLIESKYTWPCAAAQMRVAYEWMLGSLDKPAFVQ